jgi:Skp family chaperone for outer membrane proteins
MKGKIFVLVLVFLTAFALAFMSVPTFAQTSLKIAVADTDKVFKESIWGKKAIEQLERETEEWQKKGEQLDREIATAEEKLAKQQAFLDNKEEEQRLQNEIEMKRMEGRDLIQQGNARLAEKRQNLLEPILEEIRDLIKKLAIEENYDILLEKQLFVLYLDPEYDITNRIVVMLDKVYKDKMQGDKSLQSGTLDSESSSDLKGSEGKEKESESKDGDIK